MTPERWQRIEELFFAALEEADSDRSQFLKRSCADDESLRIEVEALLNANQHTSGRLEGVIHGVAEMAVEDLEIASEPASLSSLPFKNLGPYEILQKIGSGGLSTVYLAERADGEYRMKVAIKLVRRGMESRDILDRLLQERQILANLNHPNIANLLDGGTTEDGLPYFVLEYIDGQHLDRFCDEKRLTIEERLHLFLPICAAVQYAHRNLVIHRDLKPANILITEEGVPKLLDFGIAKLLDPRFTPQLTQTGLRMLTPDYASPEQFRGASLTTATDVYSLGVVLYRLLSGRSPYAQAARTPEILERSVLEENPERLTRAMERQETRTSLEQIAESRRTSTERLQRHLQGDLENIVSMALRKEPERRYRSVEQLAEDIRRFLDQRPILAREESLTYRIGKFVRRNRVGVLAAALILLSLIGGLIATAWQSQIAQQERDRAEESARIAREQQGRAEEQQIRAETVSSFLIDLFIATDPAQARGNEITASDLLARGSERISNELSEEPEVQAMLLQTIARVYQNLGQPEQALGHFEEALALRREHLGEDHPEVATSLTDLADLLIFTGDLETAEAYLRRALKIREGSSTLIADLGQTLNDLGVLLRSQGKFEEAEDVMRSALQKRSSHLGKEHPETVESLSNLAAILYGQLDLEAAEPLFRQVLDHRQRILGREHPDTVKSLSNLAQVLRRGGKLKEAEEATRQVLEVRQRLFPDDHPELAFTLNNLANVLLEQEKSKDAIVSLEQALNLAEQKFPGDHHLTSVILINRAEARVQLGQIELAKDDLRQSLAMLDRLFPARENARKMRPLRDLAKLEEDPETQLPLLRRLLAYYQALNKKNDPRLPESHRDLAQCLIKLGRHQEAEAELEESLRLLDTYYGPEDVRTVACREELSELRRHLTRRSG